MLALGLRSKVEKHEVSVTPEDLSNRLMLFAVSIAELVDELPDSKLGRQVEFQLVKCGTSPGANYEECCAASTKRDFLHKPVICQKELREAGFWLRFTFQAKLLLRARIAAISDECEQLTRIFASSILTVKRKHHLKG